MSQVLQILTLSAESFVARGTNDRITLRGIDYFFTYFVSCSVLSAHTCSHQPSSSSWTWMCLIDFGFINA